MQGIRREHTLTFVCPECRGALAHADSPSGEEESGLACLPCGRSYAVSNGIPRFVPASNYADSFGFQWNIHARTQLDSCNGTTLSRDRFFQDTGWPTDMTGERILEAGCGAGRFTEVVAQTGADVFSFDLSAAVDANKTNTGHYRNVTIFQADIFRIPLRHESFDRVYCLGVLQHTPDPRRAFMALVRFVRPGGHIAVDLYDIRNHRLPHPQYLLRPFTKRMPSRLLYRTISTSAPYLLPLKRRLRRGPGVFRHLSRLIPIYDYAGVYALNKQQLQEWAILDTFDALSPWHEHPQTPETVREWLREAGLENVFVGPGANGIAARGQRPYPR